MTEDLTRLRDEIAGLDRALLGLLERRFALAAEVGRLKAEQGLPVVVRDVEQNVLARAREAAELCGVSPEVMDAIFAAIMRGAVERQHRVGVALRARGGARTLVVGAAGGMGSWLRRFLESIGHGADGVDIAWAGLPPSPGRWAALADVPDPSAYDAVFVAVDLESTAAALAALTERRVAAPVIEVASIKSHLREPLAAARRAGLRVLSLHPMFGPGKSLYEPLTVVHAVLEDEESERAAILALLAHPYLDLVSLPLARHDALMGWLLGLSHLTGLLFADALSRSGLDPRDLQRAASTSFSRQVATSRSVMEQDFSLYFAIQRLNPYRGQVYAALTAALGELTGAVERGDRSEFANALERARASLPELPGR